jgi:hypothetical protein
MDSKLKADTFVSSSFIFYYHARILYILIDEGLRAFRVFQIQAILCAGNILQVRD